MLSSAPPPQQLPRPEPAGTLLETDDDIRKALVPNKPAPTPAATEQAPSSQPPASIYRPTVRAPVAILTVFDDGKSDGEVIRIRGERFVIGRSEGDLLLPHDGRI